MDNQNSFSQFSENLQIATFLLPDKTRFWHLSRDQVSKFIAYTDERLTRAKFPDIPPEVISWLGGPALYQGIWGDGFIFENFESATPFLHKIREASYPYEPIEDYYFYFTLDDEYIKQIKKGLDYLIMSRKLSDTTQSVIVMEKPHGYLIEGSNLWFPTEEFLKRYDKFIMKVESWL